MLKFEQTPALPLDKRAAINGLVLDWDAAARISHVNFADAAQALPADFSKFDCRWIAPGQYYVVGDLPAATEHNVTLTDQSHGTVLICLSGENSEQVLSSLTGAVISSEAFECRPSVQTRLGHISVNLTRLQNGFSIIVPRSFVLSVWSDIEDAMRLFG